MTYTVKYKLRNQFFWRKIKNVKGDLFHKDIPVHRIFILEDESRIEIPILDTIFSFSKERFIVIKQNMEKESGHV